MSESQEVKTIYKNEMDRLADKVRGNLGVDTHAETGHIAAVPMPLLIAEAVKEAVER